MNSTAVGHQAETYAASYLIDRGYTIMAQNWRTRYCEIDLVANKQGTIYFVEVKYRAHQHQGVGLDYITPTKLRQMGFAAKIWLHRYGWMGEYRLAALEVSGLDFKVTNFLTEL